MAATRLGAQPRSDRGQVVVQVMAAINQRDPIAEPDDQLGGNPAAHSRLHRVGYGVHVRQEAASFHLAGNALPDPSRPPVA